jgi:cobyrinic acid a,c-diamide synthase
MIAGTRSGCGKTTLVCALLAAFKRRGLDITAFKCGPDYIDPMFHRSALGVPSYNLDPFFMDAPALRAHLAGHSPAGEGSLCIIEGAMGYYDGIAFTDEASAFTVARVTETPVVLVIDAKGIGNSAAAVLEGFVLHRRDSNICGVIFNNANEALYAGLRAALEKAGLPRAFGYLPRRPDCGFESRHLGLMTAQEIPALQEKLAALGQQAEETIDLDGLLRLRQCLGDTLINEPRMSGEQGTGNREQGFTSDYSNITGNTLIYQSKILPIPHPPSPIPHPHHSQKKLVQLGVARDEAFCFHYAENFELFEALGCELVFFSPLHDGGLPENLDGLYLAGGYPELHVKALAANRTMRRQIREALAGGLPTIAECGGFLYLHETLDGEPMAGVIAAPAQRTEKLQRFGYITLTALSDNVLCHKGEAIRAHEFHYWESGAAGDSWMAAKAGRSLVYRCAYATKTLYAGFPHLYLPANPAFALNFTEAMREKGEIEPTDIGGLSVFGR